MRKLCHQDIIVISAGSVADCSDDPLCLAALCGTVGFVVAGGLTLAGSHYLHPQLTPLQHFSMTIGAALSSGFFSTIFGYVLYESVGS